MEFLERLELHTSEFTNTEKRISDYVLAHPTEVLHASINDLAELCGASRSAVLRYTQRLGYSGFTEFRYDFSLFIRAGSTHTEKTNRIQTVATYYERAIDKIAEYVTDDRMNDIVNAIIHARRIKIFGLNRNSYSAQQLRHHIHTLNFDAEAVYDTVLVRDLPSLARHGDVHIYFSVSGQTPIVSEAIQLSRQHGATTILITMRQNSPMAAYADYPVVLPSTRLITTNYFLDQQAINFIFIEMLIIYLGNALSSHSDGNGRRTKPTTEKS